MTQNWNYQDIIDLEHFMRQDADLPADTLHVRDRQLYLDRIEPQLTEEPQQDQQKLLRLWLQVRREEEFTPDSSNSPSSFIEEARRILRLMLALLGTIFGASAGFAFFHYTGATPVNVLHFLALFVISQLLLVALLALTAGVRKIRRSATAPPLTLRLAGQLSLQLVLFVHKQFINRMAAKQRQALMATIGRLRATQATYASLFSWPLFLNGQLFGICFNLGLLAATLFKITVSDLAFGWQSTIQFSSQALLNGVQLIALPWSWCVPEGVAYPTLAEIDGSHIVLKEGIYHLATTDLISWWPFLLLSVFVYGLLIRILLLGYGCYRQKKAFLALSFDRPAELQLARRMVTPIVATQAEPEPPCPEKNNSPEKDIRPEPDPGPTQPLLLVPLVTLIPDEIYDTVPSNSLECLLKSEGFTILDRLRFLVDYDTDQQLLEKVGRLEWPDNGSILILMEAWMPPIVSFLTFLADLRRHAGTTIPIHIRLIGKPAPATALTPVQDGTMEEVWQHKLSSLGDPYLHISPLVQKEQQ